MFLFLNIIETKLSGNKWGLHYSANTLHELRVNHMLDIEKIKSIISTSQDIMLVFFFTKIQLSFTQKYVPKCEYVPNSS